jgi:hypothetical protein
VGGKEGVSVVATPWEGDTDGRRFSPSLLLLVATALAIERGGSATTTQQTRKRGNESSLLYLRAKSVATYISLKVEPVTMTCRSTIGSQKPGSLELFLDMLQFFARILSLLIILLQVWSVAVASTLSIHQKYAFI